MNTIIRLAAGALFAFIGVPFSQCVESGEPGPDTPYVHQWGKFSAMLVLTDNPAELFAAWDRPGAAVPVRSTDVAIRGAPIAAVVFFTGCTPNDKRVCDAAMTLQISKPDGSAYAPEQKSELWTNKPPRRGSMELSVGYLVVKIGKEDPSGLYSFRVRVIDNVSHDETELVRTFRVDP